MTPQQQMKMKRYIGTKVVNAIPMNRQEYINLRGWQLPSDEDGTDEGYLVEYVDGGEANTSQYAGYISWSPKDVFEKSYKIADTFLDRLHIERDDLADKFKKLCWFVDSPKYREHIKEDYPAFLLSLQRSCMGNYLNYLNNRIELAIYLQKIGV